MSTISYKDHPHALPDMHRKIPQDNSTDTMQVASTSWQKKSPSLFVANNKYYWLMQ